MTLAEITRPLSQPASPEYSTLRIWVVPGHLARATPRVDDNAWPVHEYLRTRYSGPAWFTSESEAVEEMNRLRSSAEFGPMSSFARLEVRREFTIQCPYCNVPMPLYGNGHMVRRRPSAIVKSTTACPPCFAREFPGEVA